MKVGWQAGGRNLTLLKLTRMPPVPCLQVPLLAMSRVVQRIIDVERSRAQGWQQRAKTAEAALAGADGLPAGGKKAVLSPTTQQRVQGQEV